jgi:hypothetical protein
MITRRRPSMTAHERLEPNDVVRFTEDFKQWGTIVARKGDFALMRDRDQTCPASPYWTGVAST